MNYVTFHITPATGRGKEDRKTILLEQGRETIRGLLYLTSAKKRGGGVKKYPKFENKQYRFCGQRGEGDKISKNYVDVVYGSPLTTRQRGKKRGDAAAWGRGRGVSSSCLRRRRRLRCHHVRNFRLVTRRRGGAAPLDASTPNSIRQRRRNWPACSLVCRLVRK